MCEPIVLAYRKKIKKPKKSKQIENIAKVMISDILRRFLGIDCMINDKPIVEVSRKKTQVSSRLLGSDIPRNPITTSANPMVALIERFWFASLVGLMVFTL